MDDSSILLFVVLILVAISISWLLIILDSQGNRLITEYGCDEMKELVFKYQGIPDALRGTTVYQCDADCVGIHYVTRCLDLQNKT